jgi:FkbM family methyltransferase
MDLLFGNSSERRRDVCALGFEPNPRHQAGLRRLERRLRNRGHSVHIFAAAIAAGSELNISSNAATYWVDRAAHNLNRHEVGNSLIRWAADMHSAHTHEVPTVPFDWLVRRQLQPPRRSSFRQKTLMKMDVEGAEYTVLPPAVRSGSLCEGVDLLLLERHDRFFSSKWRGHNPAFTTDKTLPRQLDDALLALKTRAGRGAQGGCKTRVRTVDFP